MRIVICGLAVLAIMGATAATAQDARRNIAFRDIFAALVDGVHMNSDRAFFENKVMQGKVKRQAPEDASGVDYEAANGPDGAHVSYREVKTGNALTVTFSATEAAEPSCVTFKQAQVVLKAHGWTLTGHSRSPMAGSDTIAEDYARDFVSLHLSNTVSVALPIIEPFNPPEAGRQQYADYDAEVAKVAKRRDGLKPGTNAYGLLCIDEVDIKFAR